MIRVLLAVDDASCRGRLRELLAPYRDIHLVPSDGAAHQVLQAVQGDACDVVLTVSPKGLKHVAGGRIDGDELVRWLRSCHQGLEVMVAGSLMAILDRAVHPLINHSLSAEEQRRMADLTARELEVLAHITRGEPTRQVAERLFISEKTVRNHISNAMCKLAVENRIQAALLALRAGIQVPSQADEG